MKNLSQLLRLQQVVSKIFLLFCTLWTSTLYAEIVKQDNNNFDLKFDVVVNAELNKLTSTFEQVSQWWHPDHTYSGKSENLYFDSEKQHCFCEKLEDGGFVRHLDWVFYQPGKVARFVGGLGPLQTVPVDGVLTFVFKSINQKQTQLTVTYAVSTSGDRLKGWSEPVNRVIGEQVSRLKQKAEE